MSYLRFGAMIATSTAVMFGLMYLNTFSADHVFFSETRFWMAFVMGAAMAVIMLSFMLGMYGDRKKNVAIFVGSAVGLQPSKYTPFNSIGSWAANCAASPGALRSPT